MTKPVSQRNDRRVKEAKALWEDFTGHEASSDFEMTKLPDEDVLLVFGICEAIAYTTVRDGVVESYQHEFSERSRPRLAVSHDGRRLYLLAGNYEFTRRGIEDR